MAIKDAPIIRNTERRPEQEAKAAKQAKRRQERQREQQEKVEASARRTHPGPQQQKSVIQQREDEIRARQQEKHEMSKTDSTSTTAAGITLLHALGARSALAEQMDRMTGELGAAYAAFRDLSGRMVAAGAPAGPVEATHIRRALARALNDAGLDFVPPLSVGHADSVAEVAEKRNQGIRAWMSATQPKEVLTHDGEVVTHNGEPVTG